MHNHCSAIAHALRDPASPLGGILEAAQAQADGPIVGAVIHDDANGQVFVVNDDGELRVAPGYLYEMVTGQTWRGPGDIDPLPSHAVRRNPARLAEHEAEVKRVWLYLVQHYRPHLCGFPHLGEYADEVITRLRKPHLRRGLASRPDNFERWNAIINPSIEMLDEMHGPAAG